MSTTAQRLSVGWVAVFGVLTIGVGFTALLVADVSELLTLTGTFLTLVGLFALVQGVRYTLSGKETDRAHITLGDPEQRKAAPSPGSALTDDVAVIVAGGRSAANRRRKLRTKLRALAVQSLVARRGLSEQNALSKVDTREWPTDRLAVAFLSNTPYPPRARVRAVLFRQSLDRIAIDRTVTEIETLWNEDEQQQLADRRTK